MTQFISPEVVLLARSQTSAQLYQGVNQISVKFWQDSEFGIGIASRQLDSVLLSLNSSANFLTDFHHVDGLPTCRHLNIAGVGILLDLIAKFLVLVVINKQRVDVRNHVVAIVVGADVDVAEPVKFVGGLLLYLDVVVVDDAVKQEGRVNI